jgi:hypothetical protein
MHTSSSLAVAHVSDAGTDSVPLRRVVPNTSARGTYTCDIKGVEKNIALYSCAALGGLHTNKRIKLQGSLY